MKRRLNLLLTLLFILLILLCGAGAFFIDRQQARIRAGAASMGLSVSAPVYGEIPKEIGTDSTLTISFQVKNNSTVPVYLTQQKELYVNGSADTGGTKVKLEYVQASGGSEPLKLKAGESTTLSYVLSFPGAESLPEGALAVKGAALLQAATSENGKSGFTHGPVRTAFDLSGGELVIPIRTKDILLTEYVDLGSHPYTSILWYQSSAADSTGIIGTKMKWEGFSAAAKLTLKKDVPLYVRYEVLAEGGVVRSPVYDIRLSNGKIEARGYDYFDGTAVSSEIPIERKAA